MHAMALFDLVNSSHDANTLLIVHNGHRVKNLQQNVEQD